VTRGSRCTSTARSRPVWPRTSPWRRSGVDSVPGVERKPRGGALRALRARRSSAAAASVPLPVQSRRNHPDTLEPAPRRRSRSPPVDRPSPQRPDLVPRPPAGMPWRVVRVPGVEVTPRRPRAADRPVARGARHARAPRAPAGRRPAGAAASLPLPVPERRGHPNLIPLRRLCTGSGTEAARRGSSRAPRAKSPAARLPFHSRYRVDATTPTRSQPRSRRRSRSPSVPPATTPRPRSRAQAGMPWRVVRVPGVEVTPRRPWAAGRPVARGARHARAPRAPAAGGPRAPRRHFHSRYPNDAVTQTSSRSAARIAASVLCVTRSATE
jgi:hypothetical protein